MEQVGKEVAYDAQQRCGEISGDLARLFIARQQRLAERGRGCDVVSFRHVHVADLALLVDRSVLVAPDVGDSDHLGREPESSDEADTGRRRITAHATTRTRSANATVPNAAPSPLDRSGSASPPEGKDLLDNRHRGNAYS